MKMIVKKLASGLRSPVLPFSSQMLQFFWFWFEVFSAPWTEVRRC